METIQKFKAIDDCEFTNKDECIKYELLIEIVDSIMNTLPKKPDSCSFSNGSGYLQHDKTILRNAKINLLTICKEYIDHDWIQQTIDDENVHPSYVGRLLGDYGIKPLNKAWYRFQCIDSNLREWGQPYYASNPNEAEQVCLNN
jgi:hypothetical protein